MTFTRALVDPDSRASGPIRFTLSTEGVKRDGLALDMTRMRTDNFRRNPVMAWQHNMDPTRGALPIGRWENVRTVNNTLVGDALFDSADPFAAEVERKYKDGFLNAVSISWQYRDSPSGEWYDLLEASAVSVPADPDALMAGRSLMLTTEEYEEMQGRLERLERMVQHERARASVVASLRAM